MEKNKIKILEVLKEVNGSLTTTELANRTNIDITNIGRYTKALENEGKIERRIEQKGKIRLVNITLAKEKPIKVQEIPKTPKTKPLAELHKPKKIEIIPEIEKTETIEKMTIDQLMEKLAKSSDFQRMIYRAVEGKSWRGKDADLRKALDTKLEVIQNPSFAGLIKEMKEHFSNGFVRPSQIK